MKQNVYGLCFCELLSLMTNFVINITTNQDILEVVTNTSTTNRNLFIC